jgi:hypothetical protein
MAAIEGKITMSTCEGRPCWVRGRRAIFHRWTDSARPVKPVSGDQDTDERLQKWSVHGLVEYEDGRVDREWPNNIRFADSAENFAEYDWATMERQRDEMDDRTTTTTVTNYADGRPVAGIHEENGQTTVETNPDCETCRHENPDLWREYCAQSEYSCMSCTAPCICKTCENSNKWEPKGGTV